MDPWEATEDDPELGTVTARQRAAALRTVADAFGLTPEDVAGVDFSGYEIARKAADDEYARTVLSIEQMAREVMPFPRVEFSTEPIVFKRPDWPLADPDPG